MDKKILIEINRTQEIMGLLNEDWWGRLWGGKKRREDIYNVLKSGVEVVKDTIWIELSDRQKTPPVYSEDELQMFAKLVNKLDRIFVDESSVIEYLTNNGKGYKMGLDELDTLTQIAFKDSDNENKPEKFVDLLVLSGNFDEGEKYSLDQHLDTALSKLKQEQQALRGEDKECPGNTENPYDKETEPDIWKWCEARRDNWQRQVDQKKKQKSKNPLKGTMFAYYDQEQCEQFKPEGLLCWNPKGKHPSGDETDGRQGNPEDFIRGRCERCKKTNTVEESHHLNEINRVREIMGLKPLMEQKKIGQKFIRDGIEYEIKDLIKTKLPPINIGQKFASAVYELSGESLQAVKDLAKKMVTFFNVPDLKRITFEIKLAGGASLVPYDGGEGATVDERNMWLAEKRTEVVKKYLQKALDTAGIDNVTIPEPTVTIGTTSDGRKTMTPWDPNKGADHDDYTNEQFMNVSFKATGTREVLEALPSFCEKEFKPEEGGQAAGPDYKIYPGKGMQLNLGNGTGKITLQFMAYTVPDKFILTYNDEQYVSSNPDTGKEGFVSALFRKMSQEDLEKVKPKLAKINEEVKKLESEIAEAEEIIKSTTEDQAAKITAKLEQEEAQLELDIKKINEKIEKYGFSIPIELGGNGKYKKYGEKWGQFIGHYFDYPNRNVPNVYWFVHKDDDVSDKLVQKRDGSNQTQEEYKRARYLSNAYYNLKKYEELDEKWFTSFFQLYPYDNKSKVKKSTGYKKLVDNRNKKFKKDDIEDFFITMKKLQAVQLKNQKKKLENMKEEIPAKKDEIANRKKKVVQDLENELKIVLNEMNANKKRIEELIKSANISKREYDWNVSTGGQYDKGGSTKYYNDLLRGAGFKDGIIGPNGEITFDKVLGKNTAWLQVVAPLGGTAWELNVKCGKDNETKELTKPV